MNESSVSQASFSHSGKKKSPVTHNLKNDNLSSVKQSKKSGFRFWAKDKLPYTIMFGLILSFLFVFFWGRIVITINSGEGGVLYKRLFVGTVTDYVYPERVHLIWPWDTMHIYNVRIQTRLHEFTVLTNKGLPIQLSLAIRFRPEYEMLGVLHQQVGPDYVEKIIVPQIESVLRKNIGKLDPEQVYTNEDGVLTKIIRLAIEEAGRKYVYIDDIIIRHVEMPPLVKKAIEGKLVEEQRYQKYVHLLLREREEAKRKKIEAEGIREYQKIIAETLDEDLLQWQGIQATLELSKSDNTKVVIIGSGENGLPIILGGQ